MDTSQYPAGTRFRSVATWPDEVSTGNLKHESDDMHDSYEGAQAVCRGLQRRGLGGEGRVFPLATRIEVVPPAAEVVAAEPVLRETGFGRLPPEVQALAMSVLAMSGPMGRHHRESDSPLFYPYRPGQVAGFEPTPVTPDQVAAIRAETARRRAENFAKRQPKAKR